MSAELWLGLGDPGKARHSLRRAEDLDAQSIATERATARVEGKTHESAIASDYGELFHARVELGDPAGAQASLERALALIPDDLQILQSMVELQLSQGDLKKALAYAERLVAAAERASPADIVKSRPKDLLVRAAEKDGLHQEQATTELDLQDPAAAERASRALENERLQARETLAKVKSALRNTGRTAKP